MFMLALGTQTEVKLISQKIFTNMLKIQENELETQLNCWMELAKLEIKNLKNLKSIIVP